MMTRMNEEGAKEALRVRSKTLGLLSGSIRPSCRVALALALALVCD
jgi:hypothetical protein